MLKSLFYETFLNKEHLQAPLKDELGYRPIFTLKSRDHTIGPDSFLHRQGGPNLLRSLYQIYVQCGDPTEYQFAIGTFGEDGWEHWLTLREASFFKDHYLRMREALKVRIESEAFQVARQAAINGEGTQSLQAAKWLHDSVRPKAGKGRPTKDQIEGEAKRQAEADRELSDDISRLGLNDQ